MEKEQKKNKKPAFVAVKGIYEIMPAEFPWWDRFLEVAEGVSKFYNFERIETGIVENADLFLRSAGGEGTDVHKEMFFIKSNKDKWVLRPEATASVARAYIEYGFSRLQQPVKLFYFGPMFRHENPQAGRYREFRQFGVEIIGGENDPVFDAQAISLASRILKEIGFKDVVVEVNSIGCRVCQPAIKKKIQKYYRTNIKKVCRDCQTRIDVNPFRVFDCKREECQEVKKAAPVFLDLVCSNCQKHLKDVLEYLEELSISYELNNNLVRGLDYYDRTVFEIFVEAGSKGEKKEENASKLAVGGGGRYDYLIEMIGGRPTAGVGFSFGVERIIEIMKKKEIKIPAQKNKYKSVFFVHVGEVAKKRSLKLVEELRKNGVGVIEGLSKDSFAKQLKMADKGGAEVAVILGQREVFEESVIIKNLKTGIQETVPVEKMAEEVKRHIK